MALHILPYDLLFNIAQHLDIDDVIHLEATCKALRSFTLTRPVYRSLAHSLLCRSRPLPLPAFQRLADLSTQNLIKAVKRAYRLEKAWRIRAPRPARSPFTLSSESSSSCEQPQWYTKISAPPNEEIDWLSPITSSYTLCATKSGRVVCWDVARDVCLAEWDPRTLTAQLDGNGRVFKDGVKRSVRKTKQGGDDSDDETPDKEKKWELWKCRVEFDERAVYFTMARVLKGSYDDDRVMEFVLMKLAFPPDVVEHRSPISSPSSQSLSVGPDCQHWVQPKTPATSPPSSQTSSPNDSTVLMVSTDSETSGHCSPLTSSVTLPIGSECASSSRETLNPRSVCPCSGASPCPSFHVNRASSSPCNPLRSSLPVEYPTVDATPEARPVFLPLTSFHTTGVVMNVFLLDPPRRLLSAFVWISSSNTIGLYVLLDWDEDDYVFVDTGVGCLISSNWSCILHEDHIVIHSEEPEAASQHFYPLSVLRTFSRTRKHNLIRHDTCSVASYADKRDFATYSNEYLPAVSTRLSPQMSISKDFVFPEAASAAASDVGQTQGNGHADSQLEQPIAGPSSSTAQPSGSGNGANTIDTSFGDESPGYKTGEEGGLLHSSVEACDDSISKGKARARDDDEDLAESGLSSRPRSRLLLEGWENISRDLEREHEPEEDNEGSSETSSHTLSAAPIEGNPVTIQPPTGVPTVSSPSTIPPQVPAAPTQNPYPFPPWYPESAHFVRQWWPTLPGVPRLSCTVVLLAAHDPHTHRTRFVLAQHYFRVPIVQDLTASSRDNSPDQDDMLHIWYVSTPFEVVCVLDSTPDTDDDEETGDRPRPLVAVDFGHAVWVEYAGEPGRAYDDDTSRLVGNPAFVDSDEEDTLDGDDDTEGLFDHISEGSSSDPRPSAQSREGDGTIYDPCRHRAPKCLRFVTFPPVSSTSDQRGRARREAEVRTLEIPDELDLDGIETINIDQSQGAVIVSVKDGNIFILRYE